MSPQAYAAAIGRALDNGDTEAAQDLIRRFAEDRPVAFREFLPVFQAEALRRKQA